MGHGKLSTNTWIWEKRRMTDYKRMVNRQRKGMLYLLAIFVLGAGFTPYTRVFLGLILGGVVSFYNLYLLQRKTDEFSDVVLGGKRLRGVGMISRFAAVALAIVISIRFEAQFEIIAVVIGLMTSLVVIIIDFIFFHKDRA